MEQVIHLVLDLFWTVRHHFGDTGLVSFLVLTKLAWFD